MLAGGPEVALFKRNMREPEPRPRNIGMALRQRLIKFVRDIRLAGREGRFGDLHTLRQSAVRGVGRGLASMKCDGS